MITSRQLNADAEKYYQDYVQDHPEDEVYRNKYPALCGIMAAQAAAKIREASHLKVEDTDSLGIIGYTIMVYENGQASKVKGSINFSRHQFRALLRQLVQGWADEDPEDWTAVNLSGLED